jgi:hypothetical protein
MTTAFCMTEMFKTKKPWKPREICHGSYFLFIGSYRRTNPSSSICLPPPVVHHEISALHFNALCKHDRLIAAKKDAVNKKYLH